MRWGAALWLLAWLAARPVYAADHAVILLYHHVDETTPESTSVTPALFARHLDYLDKGGYTVWPLGKIMATLAAGGPLPEKTVAITFDDAYRSVAERAGPLLARHGWPFTIFVSTGAIDAGYRGYLTWDELRRLTKAGAEIGNHSDGHAHLVRRLDHETDAQWRSRVEADIQRAQQELHRQLGVTPALFAYPYGEFDDALRDLVRGLGYFGIAQLSGAVGRGVDTLAVPRFPMASRYADMDRFAVRVNARPLPVDNVAFKPRILQAGQTTRGRFAFDLLPGDYREARLRCYGNDGTPLAFSKERTGSVARIVMPLPDWPAGRRKINCTAPSSKDDGVFYWYAQQWLVKRADGSWYRE